MKYYLNRMESSEYARPCDESLLGCDEMHKQIHQRDFSGDGLPINGQINPSHHKGKARAAGICVICHWLAARLSRLATGMLSLSNTVLWPKKISAWINTRLTASTVPPAAKLTTLSANDCLDSFCPALVVITGICK